MYGAQARRATKCARASTAAGVRITRRSTQRSDERHRAFGAVWHINCHSMPAVGDALADDPGRARADFVLGDRDGTTCEPAFTRARRGRRARLGLHRGDQRPVQGRGDRAQARPAGGEAPQPADRAQAHASTWTRTTLVPNAGYAQLAARPRASGRRHRELRARPRLVRPLDRCSVPLPNSAPIAGRPRCPSRWSPLARRPSQRVQLRSEGRRVAPQRAPMIAASRRNP